MIPITKMRQELQWPRRPFDTWYGKHVMRRVSIFITWLFIQLKVSPNQATFLSLIAALAGAIVLSQGFLGWGILLINLWYLLDHVDGELARMRNVVGVTGFFFDTVVNAIAPPLTLLALGVGLSHQGHEWFWLAVGFIAFYANLMLLIITFCESAVILQRFQRGCLAVQTAFTSAQHPSFPKRIFALIHHLVTFPVVLPIMTSIVFLTVFMNENLTRHCLEILLGLYALTATFVWIMILSHTVLTQKIDKQYQSVKPEN